MDRNSHQQLLNTKLWLCCQTECTCDAASQKLRGYIWRNTISLYLDKKIPSPANINKWEECLSWHKHPLLHFSPVSSAQSKSHTGLQIVSRKAAIPFCCHDETGMRSHLFIFFKHSMLYRYLCLTTSCWSVVFWWLYFLLYHAFYGSKQWRVCVLVIFCLDQKLPKHTIKKARPCRRIYF